MKSLAWVIATSLGLALPAFAQASPAWLTEDIGLMAGPDTEYPLVGDLQAGSEVDIQGCTEDMAWCDVIAYDERGWVPAEVLQFDDEGQWLPVPEYAPNYGIPIVQFSIQSYWGSYYRYQPFYGYRYDWYRWTPPPRRWQRGRPPYVQPMPHPIYNQQPHVQPLPRPIYNQPPHVQPLPRPIFDRSPRPSPNRPPVITAPPSLPSTPPSQSRPWPRPVANPPPRVMPLPHPVVTPPPRLRPPAESQRPAVASPKSEHERTN